MNEVKKVLYFKDKKSFDKALPTLHKYVDSRLTYNDTFTSPDHEGYGRVRGIGQHNCVYLYFAPKNNYNPMMLIDALRNLGIEFSFKISSDSTLFIHHRKDVVTPNKLKMAREFIGWTMEAYEIPTVSEDTYNVVTSVERETKIERIRKALLEGLYLRHPNLPKEDFIYYISGNNLQSVLKYGFGEYENEPTLLGTVAHYESLTNTISLGYDFLNHVDTLPLDEWMVLNTLTKTYSTV